MTLQIESLISPATRQNWHKLGILQNQNLDLRLSNLENISNKAQNKKTHKCCGKEAFKKRERKYEI